MKTRRTARSIRRLLLESLESRRVLAGGEINLGPQTDIFDQPYVEIALYDGPTLIGPTGGDEFGIYPYNRLLLDTGANGIIAVNDVVTDMERNGFTTEGDYEESGVSGTSFFNISAPYEFRYKGSDGVEHTLAQTADDVRIMTNPTMTFGNRASEGGIPGIAGMPLMAGRVTTLDMRPWDVITDLFDLPPVGVTFSDSVPPDDGHRYSVVADTRTWFDPRDGLPEGSPPDAPLPSWAPITFFDVVQKYQGTAVTGGFLLDTGAQLSIMSSQIAFDLGLDENGNGSLLDEAVDVLPIIGVGGTIDIPLMLIDEISIPTEQGTLITYGGGPDDYIVMAVHDIAPGIDGIFGADLLTAGLGINFESEDFEVSGKPYFTQIHMDFRNLVAEGEGRLYFDVNAIYDIETPLNVAPTISIEGSATYTENQPAVPLVSSASVDDSDSPDFDSGTVTAAISVNVASTDRLEIIPGGGIAVDGDDVSYNGTLIGTVSGGTGITPLVVTLNESSTPESAAALIERIGFRSLSDEPSTQARTIEFRVTDGDGGESNTPTQLVDVVGVNDAPVLNTALSPALRSISEDAVNPASTLVSTLIANAVVDPDAGALRGIAVTSAWGGNGTWEFSLDGAQTWQPMGTPSESAALLLPGWARVRLLPKPDFNGTARIYYRAWDQTQGSSGGTFNLVGSTGGETAFSVAKENATLTVRAVNDAPVLDTSLNPALTTIAEDAVQPASTLVSALLKDAVSDPDANARRGIAVTTASNFNGAWQFSLDGGTTWQALGTTSESAARLLPGWARVRLLPKPDFNGTLKLYYRAWDQTQGTAGGTFKTSGNLGGIKAFSIASESATLTVLPVNDAPQLGLGGSIDYVRDQSAITLARFAAVSDIDSANFAGGRLLVRIDQANSSNRLAIGGGFVVDSNNNVRLDGIVIGKRTSSGFGSRDLVITLYSRATSSIVQQLVRSITFKTVNGSPGMRTAIFSVSDGDGGWSDQARKTINVL